MKGANRLHTGSAFHTGFNEVVNPSVPEMPISENVICKIVKTE